MNELESCPCYTVAVQRDFVARHFLVGGDWGAENELHSHHYKVEVRLEGAELDRHGYLVDIVDIEQAIDGLVGYYRDSTLNELKEFVGLNPSIEHLARVWCDALSNRIQASNISSISVRVWENDIAWAAYRRERR
jgi:6-pyruvoyltetrahydropterin/6-carboxytetrahydropterin synthase